MKFMTKMAATAASQLSALDLLVPAAELGFGAHYGYQQTGRPIGALAGATGSLLGSTLGGYTGRTAGEAIHPIGGTLGHLLGSYAGGTVGQETATSFVRPKRRALLRNARWLPHLAAGLGATSLLGALAYHHHQDEDQ
jgi:hypothetical protein